MSHFYLAHPSIRKIKEKKKKRILNIDLAILPSHDNRVEQRKGYWKEMWYTQGKIHNQEEENIGEDHIEVEGDK